MGSSTIDGLTQFYGTDLAIPTTAGDYKSYGEDRTIEFLVDTSKLTTTAVVQANTTFLDAGVFIDSVIVEAVTAVTTLTSVSIGLMKMDRTTTISDTALVAAQVLSTMDTAGETTVITGGTTYAGTKVGTTSGSDAGYLTAKLAGTAGTGILKVIVKYRGVPPITR